MLWDLFIHQLKSNKFSMNQCSMFFSDFHVGAVLFLTPFFFSVDFSWSVLLWRSRWLRSICRSFVTAIARLYSIIWWGYDDMCSMYWQGPHFLCWPWWSHIWASLFNWLRMAKALQKSLCHCWSRKCNFKVLCAFLIFLWYNITICITHFYFYNLRIVCLFCKWYLSACTHVHTYIHILTSILHTSVYLLIP